MSDGQLSSMTKALVEAAKADTPGAAVRAKVWSQVSAAVGGAPVAGGGAAAAAGSASAAKLLVVGALFGGTLTVGLAVTVLRVSHAPSEVRAAAVAPAEIAPMSMGGAPAVTPETLPAAGPAASPEPPTVPVSALLPVPAVPPPAFAPAPAPRPASAPGRVTGRVTGPASAPVQAPPAAPPLDPLAREAQLVSEARGALGRGDARRALQAVLAARALPSHQLTPEELAVQSQALRALGRPGEANTVDETLRSQFPESALAR
jgi:hypothetical protein